MAFLEEMAFTGTLGDLSAYRMRGSDKIVMRRKGGASKKMIKTSPRFAIPRLYMSEFAGCSTMGKHVRHMLMPIKSLADYNISSPITKLMKVVQVQDTVSPLGQRSILLSQHPRLLEGFSLNKRNSFDSIVRNTFTFSLARETRSARIEIPALMRDINFFPQNKHPLFSITIALGIVPDFTFNESTKRFESPAWYKPGFNAKQVSTPWYTALDGSPAITLEVALDNVPADESYSIMLSVGIRFGTLYEGGVIQQVKRVGAAKILALQGQNPSTSKPDDHGTDPDKQVITSQPQTPKDNIKKTDTPGRPQYIYTLKQAHVEAVAAKPQVYTYTACLNQESYGLEDDKDFGKPSEPERTGFKGRTVIIYSYNIRLNKSAYSHQPDARYFEPVGRPRDA